MDAPGTQRGPRYTGRVECPMSNTAALGGLRWVQKPEEAFLATRLAWSAVDRVSGCG